VERRPEDLPVLEGERVVLRLGSAGDVPAVVAYFRENLDHLRHAMPRPSESFLTEDHWRRQVARNLEELRADRAIRFFVFFKETGAVIGTVNFTQIQRTPAHACNLGYGIARTFEGRGLMSEGLGLGLEFMFREQNLHRVSANYKPTNARSGRLLRRLGFQVEGYARDYLLLDGEWQDHVLTSLTNAEWRSV
jgi:ribosomal-protein-alanine N-acetyltransferase